MIENAEKNSLREKTISAKESTRKPSRRLAASIWKRSTAEMLRSSTTTSHSATHTLGVFKRAASILKRRCSITRRKRSYRSTTASLAITTTKSYVAKSSCEKEKRSSSKQFSNERTQNTGITTVLSQKSLANPNAQRRASDDRSIRDIT